METRTGDFSDWVKPGGVMDRDEKPLNPAIADYWEKRAYAAEAELETARQHLRQWRFVFVLGMAAQAGWWIVLVCVGS